MGVWGDEWISGGVRSRYGGMHNRILNINSARCGNLLMIIVTIVRQACRQAGRQTGRQAGRGVG